MVLTACGAVAGVDTSQFEWKQRLGVLGAGLVRVGMPTETLGYVRAGLEDLRIVGAGGDEVPYWVERPTPPRMEWREADGMRVFIEEGTTRVVVRRQPGGGVTGLRLDIPSGEFYKAVTVMDAAGVVLAENQPIFRQLGGVDRSVIELESTGVGELTLLIRDDRTGPVVVRGVEFREVSGEPVVEVRMDPEVVERLEGVGETRIVLRLKAAHVVLGEMRMEVEDRLFDRRIELLTREVVGGETREVRVWSGRIYRLDLGGGVGVEEVRVPLGVRLGTREVVVKVLNGDSPPLVIGGVGLTRRPVVLGFQAPSGGDYDVYMGNSLIAAPRYDLDALGSRGDLAPMIRGDWGVVELNTGYDGSVGLAAQVGLAGAIDVSGWSFSREVIPGDKVAVQELELDAWVLARSRNGLGDLRLVSGGRQVPYILDREGVVRAVSLGILREVNERRPGVSRWRLELPEEGMPVMRIACEVRTAFFDRSWRLFEEVTNVKGAEVERQLASGRWVRGPEDGGVFWLDLRAGPKGRLMVLEMDNGDNPGVDIVGFEGYFRAPRLYFRVPGGEGVALVCGNERAGSPSYDLELLAPQVMAARRVGASLSPVELVPRAEGGAGGEGMGVTILFWGVLVFVVGGLVAVIMRLLPRVDSGE
ncbi:MAG: hypothetical protein RI897_2884 [Verrucomicrobiota bacterium]